jgi:acetyl-CoA carboxylase carboxyltransferase component
LKCIADASGIVPQIALCTGICAGTAWIAASMFDFMITVENETQAYLTTPDAQANACCAISAASEADAFAKARELVAFLPQNNRDASVAEADDVSRSVAAADIASLADFGRVIDVYGACTCESDCCKTALGYMGGELVAFVSLTGELCSCAAKRAARLVAFADSFRIPVVTVVDSEGIPADQTCACVYAKLASAYASATTPRLTAIVGKAYGAAFTLLGSRAMGADLVLATPDARIAAMSPEKAVAFLWNDKITEEKTRAAVEAEWIAEYAVPERAAAAGDIDDIVPMSELRMRLCSAIYMMASAADGAPARRHTTLPL